MLQTVRERLTSTSNAKLLQLMELLYLHTTIAITQTPDADFTNGCLTR